SAGRPRTPRWRTGWHRFRAARSPPDAPRTKRIRSPSRAAFPRRRSPWRPACTRAAPDRTWSFGSRRAPRSLRASASRPPHPEPRTDGPCSSRERLPNQAARLVEIQPAQSAHGGAFWLNELGDSRARMKPLDALHVRVQRIVSLRHPGRLVNRVRSESQEQHRAFAEHELGFAVHELPEVADDAAERSHDHLARIRRGFGERILHGEPRIRHDPPLSPDVFEATSRLERRAHEDVLAPLR